MDFRTFIHDLPIGGRRLDPSDPNAYRCTWGGALTCDGPEAEIASPPVPLAPGFAAVVDAWARTGHRELRAVLPHDFAVEGYSTHLSVAVPTRIGDRVARVFARRFAPALMLLTDQPGSPGLLVRPRPRRVEFGTEYVTGTYLRAASAFVTGSVIAAGKAVANPLDRRFCRTLPPVLRVDTEPAVERYGLYVDRNACGTDLHRAGRDTLLARARGGTMTANEHLGAAWEVARVALESVAARDDLDDADLVVSGALPLPIEAGVEQPGELACPLDSPLGRVLLPRSRPGFEVRVALATWSFTAFELGATTGSPRKGYCCIPLAWLGDFLDELDAGLLDEDLRNFLASRPRGRALTTVSQTGEPGLYDDLGPPGGLLPAERDPATGRPVRVGGGDGTSGSRPGKRDSHSRPRPRARLLVIAGVFVGVFAALIAAAVAMAGSGDDTSTARAGNLPKSRPVTTPPTVPLVGETVGGIAKSHATVMQDGTYSVNIDATMKPARARPGDTVTIAYKFASTGPTWNRDPATGQFSPGCDTSAVVRFGAGGSTTMTLFPQDTFNATSAVATVDPETNSTPGSALPTPGSIASTDPVVTQARGCDTTWTTMPTLTFTVPSGTPPKNYFVLTITAIYRGFPGERRSMTYASGDFPALTVLAP